MTRVYICQLTYQLILVQDIDEFHQKAFPKASTAPVKATLIFSKQLLNTVVVNKKVTFCCCRNDRATMCIILKKRSQHEKSHAIYTCTVCTRVRDRWVTLGTKVAIV